MRLTLRTLLAWLDDTLSAMEVREIGKQVGESPYAQELVERIQRVTRQRRLTIPSTTGADATDPNLVASYLDNELDQDLVPEYEKLCLTSDVHMAEVASVHQILSLIGQKAKVPQEAKNRMYHLVRGREAIVKKSKTGIPPQPAPETESIGPWVTPPPPGRPWYERFGPVLGALALLGVLCWSAWKSVQPSQPIGEGTAPADLKVAQGGDVSAPLREIPAQPVGIPALAAPPPMAGTEPGAAAGAGSEGAMPAGSEPATEGGARADLPPGTIGRTEKPEGVLLRYSPERREWEQLTDATALKPQDRLLELDPFRSSLVLGPARMDLVGETEVLFSVPPPNESARFQLAQGRLVLHGAASPLPFEVQFAGRNILITPPAGGAVGVERISRFEPGVPESSGSVLRIHSSEGEVAVQADDAKDTVSSPGSIVWDGSKWTEKSDRPAPAWVTDTKPTAYEQQIGEQFAKYMRANRPVITNIVEAHDDDQKDVRRLSLRALRAVGDLSYITPDLNKPEDPTSRREAIRVLRSALAQGPDSVKAVAEQLKRDFGPQDGAAIEKLLIGYTAKEARDEATYKALVSKLSAPDVGIRELALDNLRALTGRDDLQYDPDKFEGPGLSAWRSLLDTHELRAAAPVGKAEK
jgi:hypothetical protein